MHMIYRWEIYMVKKFRRPRIQKYMDKLFAWICLHSYQGVRKALRGLGFSRHEFKRCEQRLHPGLVSAVSLCFSSQPLPRDRSRCSFLGPGAQPELLTPFVPFFLPPFLNRCLLIYLFIRASVSPQRVKNPPVMQETQETQVRSLGLEDSPGGGNGNPPPIFFPGKSHGQRSLAGYSLEVTKSQTRLSD